MEPRGGRSVEAALSARGQAGRAGQADAGVVSVEAELLFPEEGRPERRISQAPTKEGAASFLGGRGGAMVAGAVFLAAVEGHCAAVAQLQCARAEVIFLMIIVIVYTSLFYSLLVVFQEAVPIFSSSTPQGKQFSS